MLLGETSWKLDRRLKCTIREANMMLIDGKRCEWFVALLMLHQRNVLSQRRLKTQAEGLEVTMRLHETPI